MSTSQYMLNTNTHFQITPTQAASFCSCHDLVNVCFTCGVTQPQISQHVFFLIGLSPETQMSNGHTSNPVWGCRCGLQATLTLNASLTDVTPCLKTRPHPHVAIENWLNGSGHHHVTIFGRIKDRLKFLRCLAIWLSFSFSFSSTWIKSSLSSSASLLQSAPPWSRTFSHSLMYHQYWSHVALIELARLAELVCECNQLGSANLPPPYSSSLYYYYYYY